MIMKKLIRTLLCCLLFSTQHRYVRPKGATNSFRISEIR